MIREISMVGVGICDETGRAEQRVTETYSEIYGITNLSSVFSPVQRSRQSVLG